MISNSELNNFDNEKSELTIEKAMTSNVSLWFFNFQRKLKNQLILHSNCSKKPIDIFLLFEWANIYARVSLSNSIPPPFKRTNFVSTFHFKKPFKPLKSNAFRQNFYYLPFMAQFHAKKQAINCDRAEPKFNSETFEIKQR